MRRLPLLLSAILALLAPLVLSAQEHEHPGTRTTVNTFHKGAAPPPTISLLRGKVIQFPSAIGGNASGYLALPDSKTPARHPAIIVIQEWWGMNDWILQQADRFSRDGYVALAIDLYRGKSTTDPATAHELMRGMPEDRAMADLKAAFNLLASRSDVDPAKIGSIGWCMGGGYSLALATVEPRLAACVMNYGRLVTDPATIEKMRPPILGNFGADDKGIPPADVKAFDAALKKAGKSSDIKIYDGAGHAFMNPANTDGYRPESAKDAWRRIDAFLEKKLK
ncbi:MAG TPA: dienelactone hydrolase family protein [Thermoanaerobaculia bacterium]|nr:dienelactone hydrolase family protein [Thermoanaerobaculia bacterium]